MMKEVTVEIDLSTGNCTVETEGYQGKGCQAVHEGFARAAGSTIAHMQRKREFNAPMIADNRLKQR
jgi:hypothetical protein